MLSERKKRQAQKDAIIKADFDKLMAQPEAMIMAVKQELAKMHGLADYHAVHRSLQRTELRTLKQKAK